MAFFNYTEGHELQRRDVLLSSRAERCLAVTSWRHEPSQKPQPRCLCWIELIGGFGPSNPRHYESGWQPRGRREDGV